MKKIISDTAKTTSDNFKHFSNFVAEATDVRSERQKRADASRNDEYFESAVVNTDFAAEDDLENETDHEEINISLSETPRSSSISTAKIPDSLDGLLASDKAHKNYGSFEITQNPMQRQANSSTISDGAVNPEPDELDRLLRDFSTAACTHLRHNL